MVNIKALSLATAVLSFAGAAFSTKLTNPPSSHNILPSTFKPPPVFKNVNLVRVVSLEKSYPRDTVNVVIENISPEAQDEYYIPFTAAQAERLGNLEVRDKKQPTVAPFNIEAVAIDGSRYGYVTGAVQSSQLLISTATPSSTRFACPSHSLRRDNRRSASAIPSSPLFILSQRRSPSKTTNSSSTSSLHTGRPRTPP